MGAMTRRDPLPLPVEPQTPQARLARRVGEAVAEHGEAAVAQVAVRLLTGATTPQDVASGTAGRITGGEGELSPAASGALALTRVWHRQALPALLGALEAGAPDVRAAALLVLATQADRLRADAAVDRRLVDAVRARCADPDPQVREAAASALGALARPEDLGEAVPTLTALVMDVDADLAAAAELALEALAGRVGRPELSLGTGL